MSNADPYLSINAKTPEVLLGSMGTIEVVAGNAGNDNIVANSLRILVSGGPNIEVLGAGVNNDWEVIALLPKENTVVMVNKKDGEGAFELETIPVFFRAIEVGGPATVSANITYIADHNVLLAGALNASQGDASSTNNNSTTSVTVTPALAVVKLTKEDNIIVPVEGVNYMCGMLGEITPAQMKAHQPGDIVKRAAFTVSKKYGIKFK